MARGSPSSLRQISSHRIDRVVPQDDAARCGDLGEELRRGVDGKWLESNHVLSREAQRDAARDEERDVGCAVQDSSDVSCGVQEVLEVVEDQQRSGPRERVPDRFDEGVVGGLAHAEGSGDRGGNELRVGNRSQADEMDGTFDGRPAGDLEDKPALARASWPGDSDEADLRTREQGMDREQVGGPAHQPMVQRGKCRTAQRSQRRKRAGDLRPRQLEELLGVGDISSADDSRGGETTRPGAARCRRRRAWPARR